MLHLKILNIYVKEVPKVAKNLMDKFWPGPLTIILNKKDIIPNKTSANLESIGIRMPNNDIALKIDRTIRKYLLLLHLLIYLEDQVQQILKDV